MNGSMSFQERNANASKGEMLFEQYCKDQQYNFARLGFDQTNNRVQNFYRINPLLRNIPDYVVDTDRFTFVVMVKGTANIKKSEIDLIPLFLEWYSTKKAPLVYAFCFDGCRPKVMFPDRVIQLYSQSTDKVWHDGVVYRSLEI